MSAVLGVFHLDGRPLRGADLDLMLKSIAHRGPDGSSAWHRGPVGLGHAMLRTTQESLTEIQPLSSVDGAKTIVADARIDNRDELCDSLGIDTPRRKRMGDSEIILAAYEEWEEHCAERLLGDFAFAIWDAARNVLFCARDAFGVKPLYFHHQPGRIFAFASEIKGLLCLNEVPRRLNEDRVGDYLTGNFNDPEITFFRNIQRLAPARCVTVGIERMQSRIFWSIEGPLPQAPRSDGECAEALRERFDAAVNCRLRSAFPVGSLLSGGLDSSSVTCVADAHRAQLNGHPLHTISSVFGAVAECDERFYIGKVLANRDIKPHFIDSDALSPLAGIESLLGHHGEPLLHPAIPMEWSHYSTAKENGVRVLLHGNGGDTVLSHGETQVADLARSGRWIAAAKALSALHRNFNKPHLELYSRHLIEPLMPALGRRISRYLAARHGALTPLIDNAFASRIGLEARSKASAVPRMATGESGNALHARAVRQAVLQHLLEARDKSAAANSVEPRYPFYDRRLVELCVSLPGSQKLNDGWTRIGMRRAMEGILPREIQWRDHKTSNVPHPTGRLADLDRSLLEELTIRNAKALDGYVNPAAVRQAYQRLTSPFPGDAATRWRDARDLWRVAVLSLWLRTAGLTA